MNLTQAKRVANLAKWKATPPAIIKSPLKHIAARDKFKVTGPYGVDRIEMGLIYISAASAAKAGNGRYVQLTAQSLNA